MTGTWIGMPAFPVAARKALADSQLRVNLRNATGTIRARREAVVAEKPDWEALRQAGKEIKDRTIANLDEHLLELERNVAMAGGTVHWARDAAEANRIVIDLTRRAGASEVVKVKSMATQEIELNEALADAGIAAYETDLAELIVQLGHDKPSHILVPAIHRNRAEIREIFAREMPDVPAGLTDSPAELAAAARAHLRRKFLSAKVAVSGANFAVAETGSLVVVESEGNGRMCLTLPEVLISVVGIEKVVPAWQDLEVFLQLLPRSSTGERMNPYTSIWSGVTPGDGPREFHLVLLDNGRTNALADEVGRQALRCIRCSACLNVCPVYERTGGHAYGSVYPGPIGAILTPQLRGAGADPVAASLPFASSLCGACFEACPVLIDIPEALVHLRAEAVDAQRRKGSGKGVGERLAMRAAGWVFSSRRRFEAAQRGAALGGRVLGRRGRIGRLPWPLSKWTDARDAPAPPPESFREWWRRTRGTGE
ncbi:L-lactate dehydrogenase complex protein LldF [Herbihabitans rhizosphaerae]|uniref:L-lactate dehydrogenase complex protein LldF n=1 Tax=Herbihabitans rhizosphaerae TaxID=1872711 RepID=A0A4Q7KMS6_9PSEU|nr:LutB/LldF family L-lactate oxidation iron-sulfur protein [Herbihabitans rhizosphaerae]RZS36512.1 L-lactate dehydrogenase complex protein LldF [Herbihabitans rhizosphaerae]